MTDAHFRHGECAALEACPRGSHRSLAWDDARAAACLAATALPPVQVALDDALGGVLTEPLRAVVSVPLGNCSAIDGSRCPGRLRGR